MSGAARHGRRIQTRVLLLVAIGMLGPLGVMAWSDRAGRRELEQRLRFGRERFAAQVAARVDALIGAADSLEPGAPADASVRGALLRRDLAALFKGLALAKSESVDLVDAQGLAVASTDRAHLSRRSPDADEAEEFVAAAPLPGGRLRVVVRQPAREALSLPGPLSGSRLGVTAGLFAFALLFAWGAARSVTRPLSALTGVARRLTAGELTAKVPALADDEIGTLGQALEQMRVALKESLERVERARQETVRKLLAKLIAAHEEERRRVARELHDETSQALAALVMRVRQALEAPPGGPVRAELEEARRLALDALEGVHRLIADLRPSVLDDLGLRSAIRWYAERHLRDGGVAWRCEFAGLDERLPPEQEIVAFRVVQEALTNVQRHAHAAHVLIQAAVQAGELRVEIEDDGAGFEPAGFARPDRDGRGWGLIGMRERAEMLGGALSIDSTPGQGTHVELRMPLS